MRYHLDSGHKFSGSRHATVKTWPSLTGSRRDQSREWRWFYRPVPNIPKHDNERCLACDLFARSSLGCGWNSFVLLLLEKWKLTLAAGIVAIIRLFWRARASFEVDVVRSSGIVAVDHARSGARANALTARGGAGRPIRPAAPDALTRLQVARAFHDARTFAIGRSVSAFARSRPLLAATSARPRALGPIGPFGPAAFWNSRIYESNTLD